MADSASGMSKAAKKNMKRKAKKASTRGSSKKSDTDGSLDLEHILSQLKEELEHAKDAKDLIRAGKLREQVWVITDIIKGVRTDLPEEELLPILQSIPALQQPAKESADVTPSSSEPEKRLRNMRKKLTQTENLKERQAKGETLESSQLDKIAGEENLRQEIEDLEELINSAMKLK